MDEPEGPESNRVRLNAIDDDGDDDDFIGFCAFEAAEAEGPDKNLHSDERQCLQALGFEADTHDKVLRMTMSLGDGVYVSEVFSPPRFTAQCQRFGLSAGIAMDLRNGWDFDKPEHRRLAWRHMEEEKPDLRVGSPECEAFSMIRHMNKHSPDYDAKMRQSYALLKFVCEL